MGTQADHQITEMLSIRYDYHGGPVNCVGPVLISMEVQPREPVGFETVSMLLCSELTRAQAGELLSRLEHALMLWDLKARGM